MIWKMIECEPARNDPRLIGEILGLDELQNHLKAEASKGLGGICCILEKFKEDKYVQNKSRGVHIYWKDDNPTHPANMPFLSRFIVDRDSHSTYLEFFLGKFNQDNLAEFLVAQGPYHQNFGGIVSRQTLLQNTYRSERKGHKINFWAKPAFDESLSIDFVEPQGLGITIYNNQYWPEKFLAPD